MGGCYGASGAAAFTAAAATPEPAGGPEVLPSAAARDIAVAGSGGGSCRGRRVFPPPRPAVLGSPARPTSSAPLPLTLRASSPASPHPHPPSPQAEWCGPPPADRPGIPARSPGLAPARSLPLPPPRAPRRRRRRLLRAGPRPSRCHRCRRRAPPPPPPPSTMGDAGSERSKAPSLPPRCPCGFWGSSKTMNLCSKCFADFQKKQPDDDSTPSTSNSQSDLFSEETTSDSNDTSITAPALSPSQQPLPTELNVTAPSTEECGPCTDTAHVSLITPTKRSCGTDSQSESEASPAKRPRPLENAERPEEASRSKQKSRRRCFQCQTKLELVQQELGSCRCGYVFCMLHRLPEQHDCTFDHMGRGREEAIMKMVKLDRKVGRSCQRIGEGCS